METVKRNDIWSTSVPLATTPATILPWLPPTGDAIRVSVHKVSVDRRRGFLVIDACVRNSTDGSLSVAVGGLGPDVWIEFSSGTLVVRAVSVVNLDGGYRGIKGLSRFELGQDQEARIQYQLGLPLVWFPKAIGFYSDDHDRVRETREIPISAISDVQLEIWYESGIPPGSIALEESGKYFGLARSDKPFSVDLGDD